VDDRSRHRSRLLDAGFANVFYVAKISADVPAQDTYEVVGHDAEGEGLTRLRLVSHNVEHHQIVGTCA
jgi:hypothetical protein